MSVTLRSVAALLSVFGILATAACGGGDAPGSQARSEARSQVQNPDGPVLPEEATKNTPEGAAAFTKHFFAAVNYAFASGRIDGLVQLSAPTCEICRATIGDVKYAFGRGKIRGGEVRLQKIGPPTRAGEFTNRLVTYSEAKYEEVDRDGKVVYAVPAKKNYQLVVKLKWTGSGWQVAQLNRHGQPPK